jgi:transcription termination factor Rho
MAAAAISNYKKVKTKNIFPSIGYSYSGARKKENAF